MDLLVGRHGACQQLVPKLPHFLFENSTSGRTPASLSLEWRCEAVHMRPWHLDSGRFFRLREGPGKSGATPPLQAVSCHTSGFGAHFRVPRRWDPVDKGKQFDRRLFLKLSVFFSVLRAFGCPFLFYRHILDVQWIACILICTVDQIVPRDLGGEGG